MLKRWNALLLAICLAVGNFTATANADDQQIDPAAKQRQPPRAKDFVLLAFEKSQKAKTERDYAAIIYLVERAMRSDALTPQINDYARKLKGWAHNRMGETLLDRKRESAALGQFELAVELNPDHWKARHNRGVSYAVDGRLDDAIKDFTRTIQLKSRFANAWFNRGEAYLSKGEAAAAIADYTQAIQLAPDDPEFFSARAAAYRQIGNRKQALADFDRVIELENTNAAAFVDRGDLHADSGNYDRAATDYRRAIELDDSLGGAYRGIAWLMATCPDDRFLDAKRAVGFAEQAIRLDGEDDYRYVETLAAAQANAKQFDAAVVTQKKALSLAAQTASKAMVAKMQARLESYRRQTPYRHERVASRT